MPGPAAHFTSNGVYKLPAFSTEELVALPHFVMPWRELAWLLIFRIRLSQDWSPALHHHVNCMCHGFLYESCSMLAAISGPLHAGPPSERCSALVQF